MIDRTEQEIIKKWKGDISNPLVSICTITYNHEKYISEALDSFLMQVTDFPFEIVIDDDCSPDNTNEVIKEYIEKFPNIIKANLRDKNIGVMPNFTENVKRAQSKYIALCEGDDYWIDPLKLQKQVDFLDKNENYSMCYHAYNIKKNNNLINNHQKKKDTISFDDYVKNQTNIQTCTVLFRNKLNPLIPSNIMKEVTGTYFIFLRLSEIGHLKYMDDVMAVYRVHSEGIYQGKILSDQISMALKNLNAMYLYYKNNEKVSKILNNTYICRALYYFNYYLVRLDFKNMKKFLKLALERRVSIEHGYCFFAYHIRFIKNKFKYVGNLTKYKIKKG